jgi:hypothetical protein
LLNTQDCSDKQKDDPQLYKIKAENVKLRLQREEFSNFQISFCDILRQLPTEFFFNEHVHDPRPTFSNSPPRPTNLSPLQPTRNSWLHNITSISLPPPQISTEPVLYPRRVVFLGRHSNSTVLDHKHRYLIDTLALSVSLNLLHFLKQANLNYALACHQLAVNSF